MRHGNYSASEKALAIMNKIKSDKTLVFIIADDPEVESTLSLVNEMEQKRIDMIASIKALTDSLLSKIV